MRLNSHPIDLAIDLASIVLPTPGTSSMSRCPWHNKLMMANSMVSCLPTITFSTLAIIACATAFGSDMAGKSPVEVMRHFQVYPKLIEKVQTPRSVHLACPAFVWIGEGL